MVNIVRLGIRPHRGAQGIRVDERSVREFEANFRVSLPRDYVEFLMTCNGGAPKLRWFKCMDGTDGLIGRFFFLGRPENQPLGAPHEGWEFENLWAETRIRRPWVGARGVPIAGNGGGDVVFLDYAVHEPTVAELSGEDRSVRPVAQSFSEFLAAFFEMR